MIVIFQFFAGQVRIGMEEKNLVVKTHINPVKNAMVVDSHIKSPKQPKGKVCKRVGQDCEHHHECCDYHICSKNLGKICW